MPYPNPIEFNDFLRLVEAQIQQRLPLALYRLPNDNRVVALFQEDISLQTGSHWSVPGFVFAPYNQEAFPTVFLKPDRILSTKMDAFAQGPAEIVLPQDGDQRTGHTQRVADAVDAIQNSALQKVVLARSISIPFNGSPLDAFEKILGAYPGAFCYLFYHPQTGFWIGASPELLLSHSGNTAQTVALAGTLPAKGTQAPHWSPKEIWEQQVVTDYICSRLREQSLSPEAGSASGVRAGALWHLKTSISVQVTPKRRIALIRALHPTPAVCGFPLQEAQEYIAKAEELERAYYTGFLGPIGIGEEDSANLYVNLRCAQLTDNAATLYVGGGITSGSIPELEWEETRHKAGTMLSVLNYSG